MILIVVTSLHKEILTIALDNKISKDNHFKHIKMIDIIDLKKDLFLKILVDLNYYSLHHKLIMIMKTVIVPLV